MLYEEVNKLISYIESSIDVYKLKINGISIWPAIRNQLTNYLLFENESRVSETKRKSLIEGVRKDLNLSFNTIWNAFRYRHLKLSTKQVAHTIIFTGSSPRINLKNGSYSTLFSPFLWHLNAKNINSLCVEVQRDIFQLPNEKITLYTLYALYIKYITRLKVMCTYRFYGALPNKDKKILYQLNLYFSEKKLPANLLDEKYLYRLSLEIKNLSYIYQDLIQKTGAKRVISSMWYSVPGFAMNNACHVKGIKCFDYQHGLAAANAHPSYSCWNNPGNDETSIMPSGFYVWREADRKAIISWNCECYTHDNVVVTGNILYKYLHHNIPKLLQDTNNGLKSLYGNEIRPIVLITLQSLQFNMMYYDVITNYGNSVFWVIRVHPRFRSQLGYLTDLFSSIDNVDVQDSAAIPIFLMLKFVSINMTSFSTTVLDALIFKIPSIVTHEKSRQIYKYEISNGLVYYADKQCEISKLLLELTK